MLSINVTLGSRSAGLTLSRYLKNCYYMGPDGRLREYPQPDDRPLPPPRLKGGLSDFPELPDDFVFPKMPDYPPKEEA